MSVVSNLNDSGAGSLRNAISAAVSGEIISFSVTGTISLTTGELLINKNLSIIGPGAAVLTIDAGSLSRVFNTFLGEITITDLKLIGGTGLTEGGCIHNEAKLTLDDIDITTSASLDHGGGIWNSDTIIMSNVSIDSCTALGGNGGGIHNTGTINASDLDITNCVASEAGGGVYNEGTYTHSRGSIDNNTANGVDGGGGIRTTGTTFDADHLEGIVEVTFSGNASPGAPGAGGSGVSCQFGTVTITRCALIDNDFVSIRIEAGTLVIDNSTLNNPTPGSGIYLVSGTGTVKHCTITGNQYGIIMDAAVLEIQNTIVCGNDASDFTCDPAAIINSTGYNIIGTTDFVITPGAGDQMGVLIGDVHLGPLQDNGGPTFTHALLSGSAALDAGTNVGAPATDQRGTGYSRIQNGTIDVGAFEAQVPTPQPVPDVPGADVPPVVASTGLRGCVSPPDRCGFLGVRADDAFPGIANLSAEAPDHDISSLLPHPAPWDVPPLSGGGGTISPPGEPNVAVGVINNPNFTGNQPCTTYTSGGLGGQVVTNGDCSPDVPPLTNDWNVPPTNPDQPGTPRPMIPNDTQICSVTCADGSEFTSAVFAGVYSASTKVLANEKARTAACRDATYQRICLSDIAGGCVNAFYNQTIRATLTPRTLSWRISAGSIPPGTLFQVARDTLSARIFGNPNVTGIFPFTIQVTDNGGRSVSKTYTVEIIAVSPETLAIASRNVFYSDQFLINGCGGDALFNVVGTLPDGLTLTEAGLLSGTPTMAGTFSFSVAATCEDGSASCLKDYTLEVIETVCLEVDQSFTPPTGSPPIALGYSPVQGYIYAMVNNGANTVVSAINSSGTVDWTWSSADTDPFFKSCAVSDAQSRVYFVVIQDFTGILVLKVLGTPSLVDIDTISLAAVWGVVPGGIVASYLELTDSIILSGGGAIASFNCSANLLTHSTTAGFPEEMVCCYTNVTIRIYCPTNGTSPPSMVVRNTTLTPMSTISLTDLISVQAGAVYTGVLFSDQVITVGQDSSNNIVVVCIDPNTETVVEVVDTGLDAPYFALAIAVDQAAQRVYIGLQNSPSGGAIVVFDTTNNTACTFDTSAAIISQIAVNPADVSIYAYAFELSLIQKYGDPNS